MTRLELMLRVAVAERALRVARVQKVGVSRALRAWHLAVARLAAATPAMRTAANG